MRTDVETIVDRLREGRSLPWLRVIDDAALDRAADAEPAPDAMVEPYRWLLRRIGDGVRLTPAGYLPPAVVTDAMTALGWEDDWYGKFNRENQTLPVLDLRESAQRFGLLRKYRGDLLVTRIGRKLVDDPGGLWWHLAERMPDARSEPERDAGVLYLLTVAAGRTPDDALLATGMTILGWREIGTPLPVEPLSAFSAARDTWAMLVRLGLLGKRERWGEPKPPPTTQGRTFARAALLGRAATPSDVPMQVAPEDCGGPWGYEHLLEALSDPDHEDHEHLLDWVSGGFDPEGFALAKTNENLVLYDRHTRQRRMRSS